MILWNERLVCILKYSAYLLLNSKHCQFNNFRISYDGAAEGWDGDAPHDYTFDSFILSPAMHRSLISKQWIIKSNIFLVSLPQPSHTTTQIRNKYESAGETGWKGAKRGRQRHPENIF